MRQYSNTSSTHSHRWAYPIPVPGVPIGNGWAGTSSLRWAYFRASLPHGLCYGFCTPLFIILSAFPVFVIIVCIAFAYLYENQHLEPGYMKTMTHKKSEHVSNTEKNIWNIFTMFFIWALFFACVNRDCDLNLLPGRLSPHLAWTIIALITSSSLSMIFISTLKHTKSNNKKHSEVVLCYSTAVFFIVIIFLSIISSLRFFNVVTLSNRYTTWSISSLMFLIVISKLPPIVKCL